MGFFDKFRATTNPRQAPIDSKEPLRLQIATLEAERDGLKRDLTAANDKFKAAVRDMEAQAREIASLRPDAEAMRAKRQRDRDLKAGKKAQTAVATAKTPKKGASK